MDEEIGYIEKIMASKRMKYDSEYFKKYIVRVDEEEREGLKQYVGDEKMEKLYDMRYDKITIDNPDIKEEVVGWMQSSLHCPATESACERFFRELSIVAKKPYRTNMNDQMYCQIAFIHHYAQQIYYLLGNGKREKYDLADVFLKEWDYYCLLTI